MKKTKCILGMFFILSLVAFGVANAGELDGKLGVLYKCAFPLGDTEINLDGKITEPFWQFAPWHKITHDNEFNTYMSKWHFLTITRKERIVVQGLAGLIF